MKNILLGIGTFILGACVGGIIVHNIYTKVVDDLINEREEIIESFNKREEKHKEIRSKLNEEIDRLRPEAPEEDTREWYQYESEFDYLDCGGTLESEPQLGDEIEAEVDEYGEPLEDDPKPLELYPIARYNYDGEELEEITVSSTKPYNIPQEEFMVYDHYESADYTYFKDGWVTDDQGYPVDPGIVKERLGTEFQDWFGTYAPDEVWIRNDVLQMDFSVVKDLDNFVDVANPYMKKLAGIALFKSSDC